MRTRAGRNTKDSGELFLVDSHSSTSNASRDLLHVALLLRARVRRATRWKVRALARASCRGVHAGPNHWVGKEKGICRNIPHKTQFWDCSRNSVEVHCCFAGEIWIMSTLR